MNGFSKNLDKKKHNYEEYVRSRILSLAPYFVLSKDEEFVTKKLFKLGLFLNIPAGSLEIEKAFAYAIDKTYFHNNKRLFEFIISLFSFTYFQRKILHTIQNEIDSKRAPWLLGKINLIKYDEYCSKNKPKQYFADLEDTLFSEYLITWNEIYIRNWLKKQYQMLRKQYVISLFKKNGSYILFWWLAFFVIFIALQVTSEENSLSIWQKLKGWFNFVFNRL